MSMKFRNIAGSRQIVINDAEDLRCVIDLDPAFWAVTGLPVDTLVIDPQFLGFLDSDRNGRIRPDEIRNALKWLFEIFKTCKGIDSKSDVLDLEEINTENDQGRQIRASALRILDNLGLHDSKTITMAQIMEKKNIISNTLHNGDGVIPPDTIEDETAKRYVQDAIAVAGSVLDITGVPGVNKEIVEKFQGLLKASRDWLIKDKEDAALHPYGKQTDDLLRLWQPICVKTDEFFTLCSLLNGAEPSRIDPGLKLDPLNTAASADFMQKAPPAMPVPDDRLDLNGWVNPLWRSSLEAFIRKAFELKLTASDVVLTGAEWRKISTALSPRSKWAEEKPNDLSDKLSGENIFEYLDKDTSGFLLQMIDDDAESNAEIRAYDDLKKLILYQRYMLDFTNDCVCLSSLFDPDNFSIAQPGHLIIDSRHFTLATKVSNVAEHKKIAMRSDICIMYVELSTGMPTALKKMTLAVAVTSGTMRNLFIGKYGVFIGEDGVEWDAKVVDFIQQPVSISEALQMPFYQLGEFAGKQADRFFTTRSKDLEKGISKSVDDSAKKNFTQVIPTAPQKVQAPAVSGSMMLMGGGVGLAALGSAIAFIANSLKNISIWNVIAVLVGIIIIVAAPILFVSLIKLFNRSISDFYAASSWAVNPKMKLSRKMGLIFTRAPRIPLKTLFIKEDLIATMVKKCNFEKKRWLLFWLIMLLILILSAVAVIRFCYLKEPIYSQKNISASDRGTACTSAAVSVKKLPEKQSVKNNPQIK